MRLSPLRWSSSSVSSARWIRRQRNDPFVLRAQEEGYRARSAYKLMEVDDKLGLLRPGMAVVECGCAPGAWTQVAAARINAGGAYGRRKARGLLVACDLLATVNVPGALVLAPRGDFTTDRVQKEILEALNGRKPDVVLSDMSPNLGGNSSDAAAAVPLAAAALRFAVMHSRNGSSFLCKLFDGKSVLSVENAARRFYEEVERLKPKSSRSESSEFYLVARGFRGVSDE